MSDVAPLPPMLYTPLAHVPGHALSPGALEGDAGSSLHNSLRDSLCHLNYAPLGTTPLGQPLTLSTLYLNSTAKALLQAGVVGVGGWEGEGMNSL